MINTVSKGQYRYIVFKDGDTWYAVAMEFNIVESSHDPKLAFFQLTQATSGYIDSLGKVKGARSHSLNQIADPEYEKMWKNLHSASPTKSPYQVNMYGISRV